MATLLETVWQTEGDPVQVESAVISALETCEITLTGTFRGWEETEAPDYWRLNEDG